MSTTTLPVNMTEVIITSPGDASVLRARQAPLPRPQAGEVLVRVQAAGINRPDVLQRRGLYPMPPGVTPVPGLEIAGEIAALGEDVTGFAVGDRVCALTNGGGYADYCVAPAGQCLPVPDGLDMVRAAALPETFFTVWANLFRMGRLQAGETVLVHGGTSGIGTTTIALARAFGARVIATASSAEKCEAITRLGGEAINYREADFVAEVMTRTSGRGADVILDIMGGSHLPGNVTALAHDGRLVIIGFMGGRSGELDVQTLILKRGIITGSTMRSRSAAEKAALAADLRTQVWPLLATGQCLPPIHQTFPLADAAAAHRLMESGEHIGKIVLAMS